MKRLLLLLTLLILNHVLAQDIHPVYAKEISIMSGSKDALYGIAPYLNDSKHITEYLGHHVLQPRIDDVARRIIRENTIFLPEEIIIDTTVTSEKFIAFLNNYKGRVVFSADAEAYLITPLEKRTVLYDIRKVSEKRMAQLKKERHNLLELQWVKFNMVDSLLERQNPKALLAIASAFYKARYRFNRHNFNNKEFTYLIALMTGLEIGVEDERKQMTWHADEEFEPDASLNLLIYFSQHYKDYKWDGRKELFVNRRFKPKDLSKEELLAQKLFDKDTIVAMNAFVTLTEADTGKVAAIAKEYGGGFMNRPNYALPLFTFRFLEQLSFFTKYCRENNIDYKGSRQLLNDIAVLKKELSFKERRRLENKLISSLTLKDITAFEYWSLIYENDWQFSYSSGRILDMFYSKNWNKLTADKKHLDWYLKKSLLFDRLSINGSNRSYLVKFSEASPQLTTLLKDYPSSDKEIVFQAASAIKPPKKKYLSYPVTEMDTAYFYVDKLEAKLAEILKGWDDSEEKADTLAGTLARISYEQIGMAINTLDKHLFKTPETVYSFLDRDWGFFMIDSGANAIERAQFMDLYNRYTEYELYEYYIEQTGIEYKNADGSLDYDAIYDLIKYDTVQQLCGGGSLQDNEVYSLIRLLEIKFGTRLGMSNKQCSSNNTYGCCSTDRVRAWMKYMEEHKLLKKEHKEPVSFHAYNY